MFPFSQLNLAVTVAVVPLFDQVIPLLTMKGEPSLLNVCPLVNKKDRRIFFMFFAFNFCLLCNPLFGYRGFLLLQNSNSKVLILMAYQKSMNYDCFEK
jgi:hypothetical protein